MSCASRWNSRSFQIRLERAFIPIEGNEARGPSRVRDRSRVVAAEQMLADDTLRIAELQAAAEARSRKMAEKTRVMAEKTADTLRELERADAEKLERESLSTASFARGFQRETHTKCAAGRRPSLTLSLSPGCADLSQEFSSVGPRPGARRRRSSSHSSRRRARHSTAHRLKLGSARRSRDWPRSTPPLRPSSPRRPNRGPNRGTQRPAYTL